MTTLPPSQITIAARLRRRQTYHSGAEAAQYTAPSRRFNRKPRTCELALTSGQLHNAPMHSDRLRRLTIPLLVLMAAAGCGREAAAPQRAARGIEPLPVPAADGSLAPKLSAGDDGTLVLSWLEPDGEAHRLRYAVLADKGWSEPRTLATGEDWFVNWADFPSVVPLSDSLWAAHWLVSQPAGGYAYDVLVALSQDGGASWSAPFRPHDDGTPTEHGFVTLFPSGSGAGLVWLDGRNMAIGESGDGALHGMTLRAATITPDGAIGNEAVLDGLTCDCCQTDVATTATGAIAVYRDRTEKEIRDIYVTRLVNGDWQPGQPVADDGWHIGGCPVNGPVIAVDGERVVVAWFTAADGKQRVQLARSRDAGASFSAAVEVVEENTSGHVGLALLPDGAVAVSWTCQTPRGDTGVCLRAVSGTDEPGPVYLLSGDAAVPPLSVPQLARRGDALVAAWTERRGAGTAIASGTLPIASL